MSNTSPSDDRGAAAAAESAPAGETDEAAGEGGTSDRQQADGQDRAPRERMIGRLALALAVAPLVVSAVHLLVFVSDRYYSHGDVALVEMYVRDIGDHLLLVGPYSRDGWFHPGPLYFYLLVVPFRLLGGASIGLPIGTLLINGASIVAMALMARRRGGLPLMLSTLVLCGLLLNALGPEFLSTPWNPWVVVLPYGVLLFLVWAMLCGEGWALPVGVFVASYLAQTHVAYVLLALPLLFGGALGLLLVRRRAGEGRAAVRPFLLALLVGVVLWVLPVVEQFIHEPGNLGEATEYFFYREDAQVNSLTDGWRVVSAQYGLLPEWLAGRGDITRVSEPRYLYSPVLPLLLVPVVAAAVVLWRRGGTSDRKLVGVWLGGSLVGLVATARTVGPIFQYRLQWSWMLGMLGGLLVLAAVWRLATERWGATARQLLVGTSLLALAGLAVVNSVSTRGAEALELDGSWALSELGPDVREWLPPGDEPVVVNATSFAALGYSFGLRLDLERHGIDARTPLADDRQGRPRLYERGDPARARLLLALDAEVAAELVRGDRELIAYTGDRSADELLRAAERRLDDRGVDPAEVEELNDQELRELLDGIVPSDSVAAVFAEQ